MKRIKFYWLILIMIWVVGIIPLMAQKPPRQSAADIIQRLEKLNVLGNVLYVAAHPDDENTRLITFFANGVKVNTGYFSFTRGDGGQNLVGPEIRESLGVIRTQELLAARRTDLGQQFFSRAVDFGYSKHPEETFEIWDKDQALSDVVFVIRKFKPDVIINRFNIQPGTTHGHHTASAILAELAFDMAGDPTKFPEQLEWVDPWTPSAIYWNTYWWRRSDYEKDTSELIRINVGQYNAVLGKSYTEIAAESRSMHKSQGFGATGERGNIFEYLQYIKGVKADEDVFDGIDKTWSRVKGGEKLHSAIDKLSRNFNPNQPDKLVPGLIKLRKSVTAIEDNFWREIKIREIDELIYACLGLFLEVRSEDYTACPGENIPLNIEMTNRSKLPLEMARISFTGVVKDSILSVKLDKNEKVEFETNIRIPTETPYSQPYWLVKPWSLGMFTVDDQSLRGKPENDPAISCHFKVKVEDVFLQFERPVIFKRNDPVIGETYRPFVIAPPVFANFTQPVNIFPDDQAKIIPVKITAGRDSIVGQVSLKLGAGWKSEPKRIDFAIDNKRGSQILTFKVWPPADQVVQACDIEIEMGGQVYRRSLEEIAYDHIPAQLLFPKAESKFVRLDLERKGDRIGYLMGAGDDIPVSLAEIGYKVDLINDLAFSPEVLDQYDAIILGIRALNTVDRLKFDYEPLLAYVQRGGNLIIQYNTNFRMVKDDISPYPMKLSRKRVTVEEAPIRVIRPEHPVLNYPNKITSADFDGWVQERGLYFPEEWSDDFEAILSSNDPGEEALDGGLLVARYGEGYFIYTGYSWFRELPAGVPGAYRIFTNLISIGK